MKYGLPRGLLLARSNLPISRNRPRGARQRTEACSLSSERELRTRSTPLPFVPVMMSCSNEVSRELPMLRSVNWNRSQQSNIPTVHPHFDMVYRVVGGSWTFVAVTSHIINRLCSKILWKVQDLCINYISYGIWPCNLRSLRMSRTESIRQTNNISVKLRRKQTDDCIWSEWWKPHIQQQLQQLKNILGGGITSCDAAVTVAKQCICAVPHTHTHTHRHTHT
jgi:hypothetical protein